MASEAELRRRALVPLWIKIFGWLFLLMGAAVPILPITTAVSGNPASYQILGLSYVGSPYHPMALLISGIVLALAVSAYGLLFGKPWGLKACLITGYGGVALAVATMAYSLFALNTLTLRLELIAQIPYLIKLNELKPLWSEPASPVLEPAA